MRLPFCREDKINPSSKTLSLQQDIKVMKTREITSYLETVAPLQFQESYDNAGLILGDPEREITGILITLDATPKVIEEAVRKNCNLILAHHPLIFSGLKKITGRNYVEKAVEMAIKNDIAVYAAHTNLDNITGGVSSKMADKLGLVNQKILSPMQGALLKLVTFVPHNKADQVRNALCEAGAGKIGHYDYCTFNLEGNGTFRGNEQTNPFAGEKGTLHTEPETRIETIFPKAIQGKIISALLQSHPYEEVAYDLYPLENELPLAGSGIIGDLPQTMGEEDFLNLLKQNFHTGTIRHTPLLGKPIQKVALCGGSGSFLLKKAIGTGADIFISGDFKYHEFFDAEEKIVIADIGHYESEQFTKELFYELLTKNFPKFAVCLSEVNTNPVYYY
jgi:dinuclear metal center YbgI/SA1388 family protein